MKKLTLFTLLLIFEVGVFAQSTYSKLYIKPATGFNLPLTKLLSGNLEDNLIEYDDHSYYLQIISGTYFFHPNWGIDLTVQAINSNRLSGRDRRFINAIYLEYDQDYYVVPETGASYEETTTPDQYIFGKFARIYFGLVHRIDKPKFIFLSKLSIGTTSFYTDWGNAELKAKGSNYVYDLRYNSNQRPNDLLTFAPSLTFGYKLSRRFIVNVDLIYSYCKSNIVYTKSLTNLFTREKNTETISYQKSLHTITLGAGLIFVISPAKRNEE